MTSTWEYIGGRQWSLVDREPSKFDDHVCSVEIERGKVPTVAYVSRQLTKKELGDLLYILSNELGHEIWKK